MDKLKRIKKIEEHIPFADQNGLRMMLRQVIKMLKETENARELLRTDASGDDRQDG